MIEIRQAVLEDVASVYQLVQYYAATQVMLPRTMEDIRESVADFFVAEDRGRLVGCGALQLYNRQMAEIRSLCVVAGLAKRGVGCALVKRLLDEAEELGVRTVFALTLAPEFFANCGFRLAAREEFPMKIIRDCLNCALHLRCQEKTVVIRVPLRQAAEAKFAEPAMAVG